MAEEKPTEKPTIVDLQAVPPWAVDLKMAMNTGFRDMGERLTLLETNQLISNTQQQRLEERVGRSEERQDAYEAWRLRTSDRVKDVDTRGSKTNADQDAVIAKTAIDAAEAKSAAEESKKAAQAALEKTELLDAKADVLEKKTDAQSLILERLDKIASNPVVKDAAKVILTALMTWLAMKGLPVPR